MRKLFFVIALILVCPVFAQEETEDFAWRDVVFFQDPTDSVEQCEYIEEVYSGGKYVADTPSATKFAERLARYRLQKKAHEVGGNVIFVLASYAHDGQSVYYGVAYRCPDNVVERYRRYQDE